MVTERRQAIASRRDADAGPTRPRARPGARAGAARARARAADRRRPGPRRPQPHARARGPRDGAAVARPGAEGGALPACRRGPGVFGAARSGRPPRFSPRRGGAAARARRGAPRRRARSGERSARGGLAVQRMAKRFIVGEGPRTRSARCARLWESGAAASVDLLGEATVTAAEADRYARRCDEALRTLAAPRATGRPAAARARRPRRDPAREPLGQGHRAHRARARRGAGAGHRGRRAPAARPPAHGQATSARTCTSTWSRWTRAT